MFFAGIATWAVLAQPCVYCFIPASLPAKQHCFPTKSASPSRERSEHLDNALSRLILSVKGS